MLFCHLPFNLYPGFTKCLSPATSLCDVIYAFSHVTIKLVSTDQFTLNKLIFEYAFQNQERSNFEIKLLGLTCEIIILVSKLSFISL